MTSRHRSLLPFVLMATACGASHEVVPSPDAGAADPWPPRCASAAVVTRWVSGWESDRGGGLVTVEGDAFYALDRVVDGNEVRRLDPDGTWSVRASVPRERARPVAQLMIWDDELVLAQWGEAELETRALFGDRASALVPIGPRVHAVAALDPARLVAVSDSPEQPPSIEIVGVDGSVLQERTPLADGWARVLEGPTGAAVMVTGADGS